MEYFTQEQIRALDEIAVRKGLEVRQMMELAGFHILRVFNDLRLPLNSKTAVFCGKGNKGGDGLAAARQLANYGGDVNVFLLSREISPDARHELKLLEKMDVRIRDYPKDTGEAGQIVSKSGAIIDALIGYNIDGAPREPFAQAINLINFNRGKGKIIAYDLPSGLHPTSGERYDPCVVADATLSLAAPKAAFKVADGRRVSGRIFLGDLGIPKFVYDEVLKGSRPNFECGIMEI